ncbi:branched-chain amino acid-binding protein [Caldovatus sediminis]|uniref:Branched-chain amino acid-binding protein n=1 Tax=Caldovatus sediminis TaxID=2041189 RepID=A0A8J2Z8G5_9PROT|nr:ABC transporter substrate-binding protein [Caldovatus sediminis]GGG21592.1 branched-chain amino acid-binding protein [Caldovatus sediminis]
MITRRDLAAGVAAATVVAGGARSAAAQDRTGVTDSAVRIGVLGSLTGVQAVFGQGNLSGAQIVFDEVNAAGGINGRRIEIVSVDDESNPARSIAGFRRLVDDERVFAVLGPSASAIGAAMEPTLRAAAQVPVFVSIFSSPVATEPFKRNVFRTGPLNDRLQGIALGDFVLDELRGTRVALAQQTDEYGRRGGQSLTERLRERGRPLVSTEVFNLTDTDFTAQLLRMRQAEPDVIVIYGFPAPAATITRQARQLGLTGKIIGSNATSNRTYPQTVGPAAVGVMNVITLADLPERADDPRMAEYVRKFTARFPDLARQNRPDLGDCLGYNGALVFAEGLRRAGRELTREGFIRALETIENFETGVGLPTTFGPERREGNLQARVLEFQPDLSRKLIAPRVVARL